MKDQKENKETVDKKEILDYSKYTFEDNQTIEMSSYIMNVVRDFVQEVLDEDGVGIYSPITPKFDMVNRKTGLPHTGKRLTKEKLKDYDKVFSLNKTVNSEPDIQLLRLGIKALGVINFLNSVHKENIDSGRGILISELNNKIAELKKEVSDLKKPNEDVSDPKVILES